MLKCLFTGKELGPDTKDEHTIQRAIGGRIRSVGVSSNEFNEMCGNLIDPVLAELYWEIMAVLGPALPAESRCGQRVVQVPGQPGRFVIDGHGALKMRGAVPVSHDRITRRPAAIVGCDEGAVKRLAAQNLPPEGMAWHTVALPPSLDVPIQRRRAICPEIEIAVLKSALLTFDHLLCADANRFTRSSALQETMDFVRRCVMEGAQPDAKQLGRLVLGLQYDADYVRVYSELRNQVAFPESQFEHILLASANLATRSLDVVFWAFRADPYAFRVCDDWRGDSVTYVAITATCAAKGTASFRPQSTSRPPG
jgi:hypothetical protein